MVLLMTITVWALAFTMIKVALCCLTPLSVAALRFAVAAVAFLILAFAAGLKVSPKDLPVIAAIGFFGVPLYHVSLNVGETLINSGTASVIISTAPIFVLILSKLILGEELTIRKALGIAMAFAGVAVISEPKDATSGVAITLLAAIAAALYTTLGKLMMRRYDSKTLTTYVMLTGAAFLSPFLPKALVSVAACGADTILSITFLGLFSTFFGYLGWYYFLEFEEASKASVFLLAIPPVSILAGCFMLGEKISFSTIAGSILVIAGVYAVITPRTAR